jgi:hypothetical protein
MPSPVADAGEKSLPRDLSFYTRLETGRPQKGHSDYVMANPDYVMAKLNAPLWGMGASPIEHSWYFLQVRKKYQDEWIARFLMDRQFSPSEHQDIVGEFKLFYDKDTLSEYFNRPCKESMENKLPPVYCVLGVWVRLRVYTNVRTGKQITKGPHLYINPRAVALRYGYHNDIPGREILLMQKHCAVLPVPQSLLNFAMWMGYNK